VTTAPAGGSRHRWLIGALLLLAILAFPAFAGSSAVGTDAAGNPLAKVSPQVVQQISANGKATFWAQMRQKADLSGAASIQNRTERGTYVLDQLRTVANQSQADLRALLDKRDADYQPFYVSNAIRITAGEAVLQEVAAQPEVERILPAHTYRVPDPIKGKVEPKVNTVEWNVADINAPQVWSQFGDRGEGIVVASIDTGTQFNHPALVRQYRGNLGGGSFDHNYNWWDPSHICGPAGAPPCDNNSHGTHTMGTMVGDDGAANQVGVAPNAKWIEAKGCETNSCSDVALLSSAQFILAPTDLNGANPRPDLRPNIVNNSWGGGPNDPFFHDAVVAWVAAGIFPAFSNGNAGPGCGTAGSPGDFDNTDAAGAFDINHNIAGFSSRGPSAFNGGIKPNIAAPGVNVRSSVPTDSYAAFNGTSMASPHVAATVALMWSAAPSMVGDIGQTRSILDQTAVDTSDPQCGGTAGNNNVWGEGRLDAFAAVSASPRGPIGTLTGTVTNASNGTPLAGVDIHATGPFDRSTTTDAAGHYSMTLPVGSYAVSASLFGFVSQSTTVTIADGQTTTQDFALTPAASHTVSGHVRDGDGNPLPNATVQILNTPIAPVTTDASGFYSFPSVPDGTYQAQASQGSCFDSQTQQVVVNSNVTLDFTLPRRHDNFGYFCQLETRNYLEATDALGLTGDDNFTSVNLPFSFSFYGQTYNSASVATNGYLTFLAGNSIFTNSGIPSTGIPNAAIYPFWDDMFLDGNSSTWTQTLGSAPNRRFVIEWRNASFYPPGGPGRVDIEVVLYENGQILTQYRNIDANGQDQGNSATIGIENAAGDDALQYSFNEATIESPTFAVRYRLPPNGFVQGHVTDANDNLALSGATIKALQGGNVIRQTTTDADGFYRMQLFVGDYTIEASKTNYETKSAAVTIAEDQTVTRDFSLRTPRGVVTPTSLEVIVPPNQTRTRTLTLSNTGSLPMTWQVQESGGGRVSTTSAGLQKKPGFDTMARTTKDLYVGGTRPGWTVTSPGDVIRSWSSNPLTLGWGVGYTGNVWISDVDAGGCGPTCVNTEFTPLGAQTGRHWPTPWASFWPADMALANGSLCQINVGNGSADNGIYCWDPNTGATTGLITGNFPWTQISQRGVAYRASDDSFYVGGWNEGVLYHVKGLSYPDKGAVISSCNPPDPNISGLAYNPAANIVWEATNSPTDTVYELNPDTCAVIATLAHPNPGFNGAGLEMDEQGNLWMVSQNAHLVYLVDSGVPAFNDVPWLSESPASGTLAPGGSQAIQVTINTAGLTPGVYQATLFIQTNSGRRPTLTVPIRLIVPAYEQAFDSGAGGNYTDSLGDLWSADRPYTPANGSGYVQSPGKTAATNQPIGGTVDDKIYQSGRISPMAYRFTGLPAGAYQVELRFAEIQGKKPGKRQFDVIVNGTPFLIAFDISALAGENNALDRSLFVSVPASGEVTVQLAERQAHGEPLLNAVRVTHRPDH
jgi:subtilisin family serine protease